MPKKKALKTVEPTPQPTTEPRRCPKWETVFLVKTLLGVPKHAKRG